MIKVTVGLGFNQGLLAICQKTLRLSLSLLSLIGMSDAGIISTNWSCQSTGDCGALIRGPVSCEAQLCACPKLFILSHQGKAKACLPVTRLGEECEASDQCSFADPFAYCPFATTLQLPVLCTCRYGYMETFAGPNRVCTPNHSKGHFFGTPHFDNRDIVPIIMGCLAAGLALCACCAGIVQLLRKKRSHHSHHTSEYGEPQEMTDFSPTAITPISPPIEDGYSCITGRIIRPENDPPPKYEDIIFPPSYEEAMKSSRRFSQSNGQ